MATTGTIIHSSSTHALIRFHSDSGNASANVTMAQLGGTNGTSVISIEHIQYSFGPTVFRGSGSDTESASPESAGDGIPDLQTHNPSEVLIQFSNNSGAHTTLYELYGSGEIGGVGRTASENIDAAGGKLSLRVAFAVESRGSALILIKKVSGF